MVGPFLIGKLKVNPAEKNCFLPYYILFDEKTMFRSQDI